MKENNYATELKSLLLSKDEYLLNSESETDTKELNKVKISQLARSFDKDLLKLLESNKTIKEQLFVNIAEGVVTFKLDHFLTFINNREFLPDSYTAYKNKIGLATDKDNYLENTGEVVLNWPYKDCILEGGQDKEDQKRNEVFFNEVLAPDQINRLLDDKVFTNWKRYDNDGEKPLDELKDTDNLIIKGNNLVVLHSLLKRFAGKVKCIYIDPPYNTGKKNSFGYNDNFNHSSWLTFMKNRLEVAKKLLRPDGVLLVQTDDKEQAYLKVLCDEIFGIEQFETSFFVQVRFENKTLAEDSALHKVVETIHVYSKNHQNFYVNKIKEEYSIEKFCWEVVETGEYETIEVGGKLVDIFKNESYEIRKTTPNFNNLKETWATGSLIRQGGTAAEFLAKYLIDRKKTDGLKVLYKVHNMGEDGLGFRYILGPQKDSAFRGRFYSGIPTSIKDDVIAGKHNKEKPVPNLLYNFLTFEREFGNCRNEGNVDIEGGKKPEQLIKFLLDYFSEEEDLVLDFFAGTGTSGAVAHKTNRQYILIEQMDYIHDLTEARLKNVVAGEQTGISEEVSWQGGKSFVYTEIKNDAEDFKNDVKNASADKLNGLLEKAKNSSFLSWRVNRDELNNWDNLTVNEKKKVLCELVDNNTLYVNYSDIENADYDISDDDKKFNKMFYEV